MANHRFNPDIYRDYDELQQAVLEALLKLIKATKGSMLTFNAKKLAVVAGLPTHPVVLTLIKDVVEQLQAKGFVQRISQSSHGVKYAITQDSPLWVIAKSGGQLLILESLVKVQ
ncbi:MAG: hypothetical protein QXN22_04190 [Thermofilaceae archaeon]